MSLRMETKEVSREEKLLLLEVWWVKMEGGGPEVGLRGWGGCIWKGI